jgi:hypothetical protein
MAGEQFNSKFFEQVEACRPGSNDLCGEDFALAAERIEQDRDAERYFERVQQVDAQLASAFHEVPVPAGLADRLLAALDAAAPAAAKEAFDHDIDSETSESRKPQPEPQPAVGRRRRVLQLAIAASLVGVVGGGLALLARLTPYSQQQCLAEAKQISAQFNAEGWKRIDRAHPAPENRPIKTRLNGSLKAWRTTSLLGDDLAVAYRFRNGATLLVCQPSKVVSGLPLAPPSVPQQKAQQSSGTHIGMWTSGGLVHVLMVSGPLEEYRSMTGTTRPVVAFTRPQGLPNRYDG